MQYYYAYITKIVKLFLYVLDQNQTLGYRGDDDTNQRRLVVENSTGESYCCYLPTPAPTCFLLISSP